MPSDVFIQRLFLGLRGSFRLAEYLRLTRTVPQISPGLTAYRRSVEPAYTAAGEIGFLGESVYGGGISLGLAAGKTDALTGQLESCGCVHLGKAGQRNAVFTGPDAVYPRGVAVVIIYIVEVVCHAEVEIELPEPAGPDR